jgi:polyphenol oxidase
MPTDAVVATEPPPLALLSPLLSRHGFRHGFFLRHGGVSEGAYESLSFSLAAGDSAENVAQNRQIAADFLGVALDRLLYLSQVHGVAHVEADVDATFAQTLSREGDILFSDQPAIACGVRTADCVPILLAQPETGAVAAIHAGWRGAVADAPAIGVRQLRARFGDAPIVAAVGPHISALAFEIGPDVAQTIAEAAGETGSVAAGAIVAMRGGRLTADLRELVDRSLRREKIKEIDHVEGCTFGEKARFFSYRRDGSRSGRHVSAIVARARLR